MQIFWAWKKDLVVVGNNFFFLLPLAHVEVRLDVKYWRIFKCYLRGEIGSISKTSLGKERGFLVEEVKETPLVMVVDCIYLFLRAWKDWGVEKENWTVEPWDPLRSCVISFVIRLFLSLFGLIDLQTSTWPLYHGI